MLIPVILSGGAGTRLWPVSRSAYPKPFMRMGDGEFGYRAYINGFKNISNPKAPRIHLKVSSGGLREMGSWDGFRPTKWFAPKPVPSVLYFFSKYFPRETAWMSF